MLFRGPTCQGQKNGAHLSAGQGRRRGAPAGQMGRGVAGPRVGEKEKGGGVGPGWEGKPVGWLTASGPSARVRGGSAGVFFFFFLFLFSFPKTFSK